MLKTGHVYFLSATRGRSEPAALLEKLDIVFVWRTCTLVAMATVMGEHIRSG